MGLPKTSETTQHRGQVPIALQLENLRFLRGSRLHTHASDIHPKEALSLLLMSCPHAWVRSRR